jgi:Na+/phosphate symporter
MPVEAQEEPEMKEKALFFDPFRIISPGLNAEALRLEDLHGRPVSEPVSLQEGLLVMSSKIIEMIRLLSKCVVSGSQKQMDACESLAKQVHEQEKVLTTDLVSSKLRTDLLKGLIRFPYRMERIGDMLDTILNCCRISAGEGLPFTDKAHAELDQLFAFLLEMMTNLRDAFVTPNKFILEHTMSQSKKLGQMLLDFRLAHWKRLEGGFCSPHA